MGSKPQAQTSQTNKVELSPEQQELADLALPFAQKYASKNITAPQAQVAGFSPDEIAAQDSARAMATGQMTQNAQQAAASNQFLMDPSILSPDSNPYLARQGEDITRTITNNLTTSILPSLRAGSVVAGGMNSGGNTRRALAEGAAVGKTTQELGGALNQLYGNAYNTGLSTMTNAIGQNPAVMQGLLYPSLVQSGIGNQIRGMEQTQMDAATQNSWMQQMMPFLQAQQIYGLIGGMPGGQGVSTVTGAQPQTNPVMGGLGGAASGAMMGSMLMPGIGTAVGAGLGGLAGLLA
jgi:hypothetical protein